VYHRPGNISEYPKMLWRAWKRSRAISDWHRKGQPVPPPHEYKQTTVKHYADKYAIKTLIETGTYFGHMIRAVQYDFEQIYSVELSAELANKARSKFKNYGWIEILEGDSGEMLPTILGKVTKPCLFWLDAHYSSGVTAKGQLDTPIELELDLILRQMIPHVILIDDAREFVGQNDYPAIEELRMQVLQKAPKRKFEVQNDIIRILPDL
jgi:hypothetical protein